MKPYGFLVSAVSLAGAVTIPDTISGTINHSMSNISKSLEVTPIPGAEVTLKTADTAISVICDKSGKFDLIRNLEVGIRSDQKQKQAMPFTIENNRLTFGSSNIAKVSIADLRGRILFSQEIGTGRKFVDLPGDVSGYRLILMVSKSGETQTIPWISGSPVDRSEMSGEIHQTASVQAESTPEKTADPLPDTLTVIAEGYPKLTIAVNADSIIGDIVMIDSSRGAPKKIEIANAEPIDDKYHIVSRDTVSGEGYSTLKYDVHLYDQTSDTDYTAHSTLVGRYFGCFSSIVRPKIRVKYLPEDAALKGYTSALYQAPVDLDSIPDYKKSLSGTVFIYEIFSTYSEPYKQSISLCYPQDYSGFYNNLVVLYAKDSVTAIDTAVVKECGRYQFSNVPEGSYVLKYRGWETTPGSIITVNTADTRTADFCGGFYRTTVAPNIYLYPESTSKVDVHVTIRENGKIPFSIPEYGNGWSVTAAPEGRINDSLGFLYYDFISPVSYQSDSGWVLSYPNFDAEVTALLSARGLNRQEILDFIDFWKRYIPVCDWVTLYPTDANRMVELTVSPKPTTLFRELYLVKPTSGTRPTVKEPSRGTPFERKGFTVVEWGGHLDGLDLNKVIADKKKK